jgi:hypothetical protein
MSTQDPGTGYAFWTSPDGSARVVYSLAVFNEIDALVNDAYRRIPRGGIETGGLLFGTREDRALRIEAFRQIECQHAFGPTFLLSENDLSTLREQLASSASDPDLAGWQHLGWFLGHTRTPLQLSDREVAWFDEFFPQPGSLTILIKPERFQPTRFGFLLRDPVGKIQRDASQDAVILPLSGQGTAHSSRPAPSIPAPKIDIPPAYPDPPARPEPPSVPAPPPPAPAGERTRVRTPPPQPLSVPPQPVPPIAAPKAYVPDTAKDPYSYSVRPERARVERRKSSAFGLKSIAILVLAAVLGCLVGYWAYLQLPSPVIPVSVREQNGQLIVEWPSAQTQDVDYAALQVNDGQWVSLSPEQKAAGHAVITAPNGDVKIDLLAKHWLRDSRGIVRYLRTPKTPPAQR